jgi:hypothetical protein
MLIICKISENGIGCGAAAKNAQSNLQVVGGGLSEESEDGRRKSNRIVHVHALSVTCAMTPPPPPTFDIFTSMLTSTHFPPRHHVARQHNGAMP